jgi:hypothetical protein
MTHSNPTPEAVKEAERERLIKLKNTLHSSIWIPLWLDYLEKNYELTV